MAKTLAWIIGIVLVIVGILGFIPNKIVGAEGLFITDAVHDLIHIVTGAIFIILALSGSNSIGGAFKVFGIIYLIVAILGFFVGMESGSGELLGFITINKADNWLHILLAIVFLIIGYSAPKSGTAMSAGGMQ